MQTLVLTGSSTVAPLASEIAKAYERQQPGVRIDVQAGGSSRGITDARRGLADIGMVSRNLFDDEADLIAHPIARDGICMIVHESNLVESLSDRQIGEIYTGELNDWSDVSDRSGPIIVVNKAEGRSTLELFLKHFRLTSPQIVADVVIGDNEHGIKAVAGNPQAIGYVSIGSAAAARERGVPIRLLPMEGIEPSVEAVANGEFPLIRTLNFVTAGEPSRLATDFLRFAQSPRAADAVRELAFAPSNHE